MTTNFRVRMRREHDSDEWFTGRERARILTHISSVRRVYEPMTLHYVGILQYSYSNNYEHPSRSRIWLEILISFLKFSLHILEHERVYILLDDYAFETFRCFGLKGFTFTSGLYLDLSTRSTGVSFLFSLYSRHSWDFASRSLRKERMTKSKERLRGLLFVSCSSMKEDIVTISQQNFIWWKLTI